MREKIVVSTIILLMVASGFGAVATQNGDNNATVDYVPGEVVVGFHKQLDGLEPINVEYINSFNGHNIKQKIVVLNAAVISVNEGEEQSFINSVIGSPYVKYAELNYLVHAFLTPNDPLWGQQWGPKRIHCEKAWDAGTGSSNVKIAIVDTGIDYNHEDISGNYVSGGYDWVNNDNDPMDDNDHGTHCAGIAAAVMNNNKGIAGVAQVKVMAEKVLSAGGSGSSSNVASGITHAADNGADIISMSLGSNSPSSVIQDACDYAYNTKGVVVVAAAGNDGQSHVSYPAAYPTVIAVGAIDTSDNRCSFSNYGEDLELMAPGYRVVSSIPGNEYKFFTGTSMACPHVAGVAALAKSLYPSQNNVWIRQKLRDTAEDLGQTGWDQYFGYGLVDASLGGGGGPSNWSKVTVKIYKVEKIDPIDWVTGGQAEWYYRVSVDDNAIFEYNGQDVEILPGWWIFDWNNEDTWTPDKDYVFDAKNLEVQIKIKLMEHDGIIEGGADDLADVSAYPGGGVDNSIDDVRGAIYQGTYNIATNKLTGDTVRQEGGYLTTNGEDDGSTTTDENDAKVWFKISDDYEPSQPNLNAYGDLTWRGISPGSTVTSDIYVENIGNPDPYGQNKLSWKIAGWPEWGTWSFSPSSGTGLKPGSLVDVHVTVVAPTLSEKIFSGVVKIVNTENPSDYVDIPVELTTPRTFMHPILNKILQRFPVLWHLFSLLERNIKLYR
ncbi:MAG: S8 family peptidase [Candidatus Thermoplasmatota archaeon]|nr:S8 family peptidase [Candidatus Thermoplasmatota archaeon]